MNILTTYLIFLNEQEDTEDKTTGEKWREIIRKRREKLKRRNPNAYRRAQRATSGAATRG